MNRDEIPDRKRTVALELEKAGQQTYWLTDALTICKVLSHLT